jgi:hypothetical protein
MSVLDSLLLVVGLVIIIMGVQNMLDPKYRENPTDTVRSSVFVIFGIFLIYLWNRLVPAAAH